MEVKNASSGLVPNTNGVLYYLKGSLVSNLLQGTKETKVRQRPVMVVELLILEENKTV